MREQDKTINVTAWPPLINFDRWLSFILKISKKKFFKNINHLFPIKKKQRFEINKISRLKEEFFIG
jgi:hypothetical protein